MLQLQIDFGRTTEVTAVATQGHPKEYKWMAEYVLQFSLGKQWLTYQESGRDKVLTTKLFGSAPNEDI